MKETTISINLWSLMKALGVLVVLVLAIVIRDVIALVVMAVLLAALLHGPVAIMAKKGIPKGVTVLAAYILLIGLTSLVAVWLWPLLREQAASLVDGLNASWKMGVTQLQLLQARGDTIGIVADRLPILETIQEQVGSLASGAFATIGNVFGGMTAAVIVLAMAYYMLVQEEEASRALDTWLPPETRDLVLLIGRRVREQVGKWFLGQLTICLFVGIVYGIAFRLIGIEATLVLAVFAAFMELVPYLGPFFAAIPILMFAFGQSPTQGLMVFLFMGIFQQFQGHFVAPAVMRRAAGLNPLISIVALLVGAQLFGVIGALAAIPFATAMSAALSEYWKMRRARSLEAVS